MALRRTAARWSVAIAAATFLIVAPGDHAYASGPTVTGQLLVAAPEMNDPRLDRTVIYVVDHDEHGAMGLIVNRIHGAGPFREVLEWLSLDPGDAKGTLRLHYGGPVEQDLAFILHTADYEGPGTRRIDDDVAVTARLEILEDVARGKGPQHFLMAMGYAGWAPGQLEQELDNDGWTVAPAEESLLFSDDLESVWERAREKSDVPM